MHTLAPLEPVDYLVIGHIAEDITPAGVHMGGTAAYAGLTAQALGMKVGMVTACETGTDLEFLHGVTVISIPAQKNTTFENIYADGERKQIIHHQAEPIPFEAVPQQWRRTPIIHLGPIAQEVGELLPRSFSPTLVGLTPQGWLRHWDETGRVTQTDWEPTGQALEQAGAVVISLEDVDGDELRIEAMANRTRILAVTEGAAGARLYWHSDQRRFQAPLKEELDATGAGDIFAAAYFIRLLATRDPWEAARFATQLSAYSVARSGLDGIPTVDEIQDCMMEVF